MSLLPPPATVENEQGQPRFGTYAGELGQVSFDALRGAYHLPLPLRAVRRKRWQYSLICTPDVVTLFSIADFSYTANAFACAVDLKARRALFDESFLSPPGPWVSVNENPGRGLSARFRALTGKLSCSRGGHDERYSLDFDLGLSPLPRSRLRLESELLAAGGAPPLTVIAPVGEGGAVNVTQKWAGMLAVGTLEVRGRRFVLDGGVGGLDYTHGLLGRRVTWRWALANGRLKDGTPVGLNVVEGFNELSAQANENALWVGDRLIPLSRAQFSFNVQDPLDPWQVRTEDGNVELHFRPIHAHREERDYRLVKSHFIQPVGTFEGKLLLGGKPLDIAWLNGVTEDQDILW
ncbi:MAG: DUF2804 domain-containing protein [Myxococcaceae bacterium]